VFNLANLSIQYGDAGAVTLIDVIVFANQGGANDPVLWAHELKHVQQFQDSGTHDFAIRYLRSWKSVEDEAYAAQNTFAQRLRTAQSQPVFAPQPMAQVGYFCLTPVGRFGPGPANFLGVPCQAQTFIRSGLWTGVAVIPREQLNRSETAVIVSLGVV
jgi:hypothetical protein